MDFYSVTTQEVLDRISRHCPESLSAYLQCLNRANEKGVIFFTRVLVDQEMCEGWVKFKNNIKKLALENLLEWHYLDGTICVTLAALEDEKL